VIVVLGFSLAVVAALAGALAIWRIDRAASWRALAMTALATGSLAESIAFLRFCSRHRNTWR
jgi:hypothetical protein